MSDKIESVRRGIGPLLVLAAAAALSTTASAESAAKASKVEAAGVGSGVAIGAMAGGPVGAILGAAFGGWIGERFHHERDLRVAAQEDSSRSRAASEQLRARLDGRERELEKAEATLTAERQANRSALEQALDVAVYFRTAKSDLGQDEAGRLARIAHLIAPMDGVVVQLDGFADKRGEEQYNEQLSAARAEAVRQAFLDAGFPAERISVTSEGERKSSADEKDLDALALERRVDIRIGNGLQPPERVARQ